GYKANKLEYITGFYTSPGFADELIHIYLATGLEKVEHPLPQDEDEFVELYEVTLDEAVQLMEKNKIYDAKTAYAITYLQLNNGVGK
ncbi:MAG TPA: NUDIX hydrolase, partial [Pseudogracilibacillus sp.]|nr:NUDIX hydrolase [Pseudogracilibacillus sp.]